ncbi:hypothetical protein ABT033_35030 [Streptomyces pharetrae]|uniref:hypothetical protein n=1 Tax=Streptomyces pharetrae TaxID=291370 RepID=UPI003349A80F
MFGSGHYVHIDRDGNFYKWTCSCGKVGAGGLDRTEAWNRSQRHIRPAKKK